MPWVWGCVGQTRGGREGAGPLSRPSPSPSHLRVPCWGMAKFLKQFKERGSVGKSSPVAVPRPGWLGREVPRGAGRAEVLARCWSPPCPRFPPASGGLNVGNTLLGLGDVLGWPHGLGTPLFVQRLRELQHRTRSLLRQRLETLEQLRVLLREEEATTSHQLQEAVEKVREWRGVVAAPSDCVTSAVPRVGTGTRPRGSW